MLITFFKLEVKLIEAINDGCYDKGRIPTINKFVWMTSFVVVLTLISERTDVRYVDSKGRTPLHFAVTVGYNNIGDYLCIY